MERAARPDLQNLSKSESAKYKKLFIPRGTPRHVLQQIGDLLRAHPGEDQVLIAISSAAGIENKILPYPVSWSEQLREQISKLLEENHVSHST